MNLTTVLIAFGTLVAVLMALFVLANLAVMIGIDIRSPIGRSLLRLSIPTLLVMTEFLLYGNVWRPWVSAAGVLVIFVLLEFGLPLLTQRDKKTYREKLLAQEAHEDKIDSLPTRLARLLGIPSYWLLLGVFLGVWLFHVAGDAQARRQKEFLVIASTPECVVLRIYGDELICAPFNRATKEVQPSFSIIKYANSASEPRLQLSLEKVGPLKLADLGD